MKMLTSSVALLVITVSANAMDLNPRTVECEWSYHNKPLVSDLCHISSGLGMGGSSLMSVKISNKGYTYFFIDDYAAVHTGDTVDSKKLWEGKVTVEEVACRRSGPIVERYTVDDGLTVCLY